VKQAAGVLGTLKARWDEALGKVSEELMANPHFIKALQAAMQGKEKLDQAAARALKTMNVPTRTEFKKALARIEALEGEVASLKARSAARPKPRRKARQKAAAAPAAGAAASRGAAGPEAAPGE
jgi:polyhydroxyalkanoate synthesis regulator phasin